jgi:hypothetical protein
LFITTVNSFSQEVETGRIIGGGVRVGEKYKILHYRANVRIEPSINSDIIAILSLDDEVEILEYSNVDEEINGVQGLWIKIKHGNIIGYTFSGNIAIRSLRTRLAVVNENDYYNDTDYIMVSLHYRCSKFHSDNGFSYWSFENNMGNELFVYINDQRINTNNMNLMPSPLDYIEFEYGYASVLINLVRRSREGVSKYIYRLSNNGIIEFIGAFGDWYWYF